jgi:cytoskeletal protein CcmA (bactofilin family)
MQKPGNADAEKQTLVEEGTTLKGTIVSSCAVTVKGKVDGNLTAPSLRVSDTGSIHGKVNVGEIVSEGELSGEVEAELVQITGAVRKNTIVRATSLQVKLAAPPSQRVELAFGVPDSPADAARGKPPQAG